MLEPGFYKILFGPNDTLIGKMKTEDTGSNRQLNTVELVSGQTWPIELDEGQKLTFERLEADLNQSFPHHATSREKWMSGFVMMQVDGGGVEIQRGDTTVAFGLFSNDLAPQTNQFGLDEPYPFEVPIETTISLIKISNLNSTADLIQKCTSLFPDGWTKIEVTEIYSLRRRQASAD